MADIDAKAEKKYKYLAFISYPHLSPEAKDQTWYISSYHTYCIWYCNDKYVY